MNEARVDELCKELGLKKSVVIRFYNRLSRKQNHRGQMEKRYGMADRSTRINQAQHLVEIELDEIERTPATRRKRELIITILHEFRHLHQNDCWDDEKLNTARLGPYETREVERDAESWAKLNYTHYTDIVTFRVTTANSRFGKLSAAAERAKKNG